MRENPEVRRVLRAGRLLGALLVLFVVALSALHPYADYLWYSRDIHQPGVFFRSYSAEGTLFAFAFIPTWAFIYLNLRRALSLSMVYLSRPDSAPLILVSNVLGWIQERGRDVVRWASPILALLLALGFANEWNTWLLASHSQSFGVKDPTYGIDLGFFVFVLPWYRAIANYCFITLLLVGLSTVAIYAGLQSLASFAKIELGRPHIRTHLSLLLSAVLLAVATQVWLKTYEIGLIDSAMFTGAGYAGTFRIGAERVFAFLLLLYGAGVLVNTKVGKPFSTAVGGGVLLGVYYLIGVLAVPSVIQNLYVGVRFAEVESPYAKKAIQMTRFAYGLEKIETRDFNVLEAPTRPQIDQSQTTLDNMRLWDPGVMRLSFESLQGLRNYYSFDDVDIDRYMIDGKQTMVMLAPREMDPTGLPDSAQIWNLRREQYTHGYGAVVAQVNASTGDGRPVFLMKDIPVDGEKGFGLQVPQVYYGDERDDLGAPFDDYTLVDTKEPELDYQVGTSTTPTRWQGTGGVPIDGMLARLAYASILGDQNLLIATNLTSSSRLLVNRNVVQRAMKAFPFLQFDNDPYIVIFNGRLVWILDGYTMSDMVPYSAMTVGEDRKLNYIRNPIKVTIDAYSGQTTGYAIDPNEPLLRAYRSIYPGLVRPLAELPPGLDAHFRYPEDLLTLQSLQLAIYHVTDPSVFLTKGDAWQVAIQRGSTGVKEPMRPYYVQMRLPDEPRAGFLQILPFTPYSKGNLSGWLAAHCDPGDYGHLTMYRFRTGAPPPGPELMETYFVSDPSISYVNRTFNNDQSEIVVGNLLVVPIGQSVMYVEPLFLRSKTQGLQSAPPLFRVVLALKDRIVVKETYRAALTALFGSETAPASTTPGQKLTISAKDALDLFGQADQAMRAGDWSKYGELQKKLRSALERLAREKSP